MSAHGSKPLVVIGGGMTGLSTALTWACHQDAHARPVIVLEKQPIVGGFVTSFRRKGFLFDTTQLVPDISWALRRFGIDLEMVRMPGDCIRLFLADPVSDTTRSIGIPADLDGFRTLLTRLHPEELGPIHRFLESSSELFREVKQLKLEPSILDLLWIAATCPHVMQTRNQTFQQYVDSFGMRGSDIREVLGAFALFSALPGERVAAALGSSVLQSMMRGAWRPRGGFIELPLRMRKRLLELGGVLRTGALVDRILTNRGRVTGVRLSDGELIETDHVVTTIDPKVAMGRLVGDDVLRSIDRTYADKVESMRMTMSSMSIHLGLDDRIDLSSLGLGAAYNVLTTGGGTYEWLFRAAERGASDFSEDCFQVSVVCPSLAIGGKPTMTLRVIPMAIGDWAELRARNPQEYQRRKNAVADFFIERVEQYLVPGLRSHIVVRDVATPATFARYSGSPTGSNYDMAPYPDNFGRNRLRMRTPIRGLFQPEFSHGVWPSLLAGMQAVDALLDGKVLGGKAMGDNMEASIRAPRSPTREAPTSLMRVGT
ncbi:MAG: NAD(P)/FAD-dependent oxidoreductase [Deltaproteobacteria bacterium]|nr:NAD(P)/FAD-dependent oxidoreductase [Deltaproteobacteria bacterium]